MEAGRVQFLVVEDDEDDYVHVSQLLRHNLKNADVERAASAESALQLASEHAPDICLLDYRLGDADGLEVLREFKNRDMTSPVIFLTGQGDEEIAVQAMKAGATDYLLKSKLTAPSLGAAVRYALTLHKKEEAVRSARLAVQASEQRFRALVENCSDVIELMDAQATILYISQSARHVIGYAPEELVDTCGFDYVHPDDQAGLREVFSALLASPGMPMRAEYRVRHKDGRWRYLEATAMNRLGDPVVSALVINQRDVTERREAEEALRISEQRYRTLVESANEGIWRVDAEGVTTFVNAKMPEMLGYTAAEMIGRQVRAFFPPEAAARAREGLAHLQQRGPGSPGEHVETALLRKDGSQIWGMLNSTPMFDREGNYTGALAMVTDITERRLLQEQLLHSQKMDAVGQLAGGVAHDFNNLLMVVSSYAELLLQSICTTNPKARHQAEEILKASRRAAGLTRQLLAFSRKQVLSPRVLDLNAVLAEFGRMLPRLIGEDIEVVVRPGAELWRVKADPAQIEQVTMNLALNARDAMPRGGKLVLETSNVRLDAEYARRHVGVSPGDYVLLAVSDTGCGIAPEVLPHIFEPFFTTKEQGKGTGLGLPTAYGIVKQSGGFVWVYSEVNHGTVFKVYLPRTESEQEPHSEERTTAQPLRGSETILVVEDEDAVREATTEYLSLRGYTVLQSRSGADALAMLERFGGPVHLVMTDVVMPGMSGGELAGRIRELRPGMPILFISGYTEIMVVQHGIAPGSVFLQKPFTLNALGENVREVLDASGSSSGPGEAVIAAHPDTK